MRPSPASPWPTKPRSPRRPPWISPRPSQSLERGTLHRRKFEKNMPLALICKALIAILLVAFAAPWAHADGGLLPVPVLTGPVIDQTGTLSASDKAALETQLQTLEQTRGAQVVVLMVPTTAPEDIASFAN